MSWDTILFLNVHISIYFLMKRIFADYVCFEEPLFNYIHFKISTTNTTLSYWYIYRHFTITANYIHPLGPYSRQSVGAAAAGSWAIWAQSWTGRHSDTGYSNSSIVPASWYSFCWPRKDDRLNQPHLVVIQQPSRIWTQDPRIPSPPP